MAPGRIADLDEVSKPLSCLQNATDSALWKIQDFFAGEDFLDSLELPGAWCALLSQLPRRFSTWTVEVPMGWANENVIQYSFPFAYGIGTHQRGKLSIPVSLPVVLYRAYQGAGY